MHRMKLIAVVTGSLGYGALLGWALTADAYDRRVRQLEERVGLLEQFGDSIMGLSSPALAEAVEEMKEAESWQLELPLHGPEEAPEDETVVTFVTEGDSGTGDDDEVDEEKTEAIRSNLQHVIDQYTASPEASEDFLTKAVDAVKNDQTPPFVISQEKFAWDEEEGDEYEKQTIEYYPNDRVALDEGDVIDIANILGWKNLKQFGGESGNPDVVFIRNRRLRIDFEVVRQEENEPLPLHVKYGMDKEDFEANRAAGTLRLREEDRDQS